MNTAIEKAQELGEMLANTEEFAALMAARDAMQADTEAMHLLDNYNATQEMLSGLLEQGEGQTEQVALLSDTLDDLREQILQSQALANMADAQNRFSFLMNQVNEIIGQYINPPSDEEDCCASGGCEGCSGCH